MRYLTLLLIATVLYSCETDVNEGDDPNLDNSRRAIILSEGQFGYGTGSLTILTENNEVEQDVFRRINSRPLGDIPQSLTQIGKNYYIPVNNSRKVEVVDASTFESVETMRIDFPMIPMFVEHLGGDSIAVTDQSSSAIPGSSSRSSLTIMDINHQDDRSAVRRRISVEAPTFHLRLLGSKLFVVSSSLLVYDLGNITEGAVREVKNSRNETFKLSDFAELCVDKHGRIWALADYGILCIDPDTERTVEEIYFPNINHRVGRIVMDKNGENIYFNIDRAVYTINVDNPVSPKEPLFVHTKNDSEWTTYGLGVSNENTIFLIRVLYGSIQRSRVFEYDLSGNIVHRYANKDSGKEENFFRAGIFSSYIHFIDAN